MWGITITHDMSPLSLSAQTDCGGHYPTEYHQSCWSECCSLLTVLCSSTQSIYGSRGRRLTTWIKAPTRHHNIKISFISSQFRQLWKICKGGRRLIAVAILDWHFHWGNNQQYVWLNSYLYLPWHSNSIIFIFNILTSKVLLSTQLNWRDSLLLSLSRKQQTFTQLSGFEFKLGKHPYLLTVYNRQWIKVNVNTLEFFIDDEIQIQIQYDTDTN